MIMRNFLIVPGFLLFALCALDTADAVHPGVEQLADLVKNNGIPHDFHHRLPEDVSNADAIHLYSLLSQVKKWLHSINDSLREEYVNWHLRTMKRYNLYIHLFT
jgi:hypothetical protein